MWSIYTSLVLLLHALTLRCKFRQVSHTLYPHVSAMHEIQVTSKILAVSCVLAACAIAFWNDWKVDM